MGKKLYVGNLSPSVTIEQLNDLFAEIGEVTSVAIITDRDTGKSKGFGFVEMADATNASEAINQLNGYTLEDLSIVVNEARPPKQKSNSRPPRNNRNRF